MNSKIEKNGNVAVWGIHCVIDNEHLFRDKSVIAIGWSKMGDLSGLEKDRESFKKAYAMMYPEDSKQTVATQAGQLYRFVCEARVGDYVVFPSKADKKINIGMIGGEYFYDAKATRFVQQRKVKWLKSVPRTAFSQGALYEAGSALTFFQIKNYVDEFLSALDDRTLRVIEDDVTVAETAEEIETQTRDYILKQLKKCYKGYAFEPVVKDLLRAMGYGRTSISKHGGDHGKDIIVYKDELPPRIVVQVKSQDEAIPERLIQALKGSMDEGDYGVFVALSHFTENAVKFLEKTPRIRAIDCDEFIDLFLKYYDKLDEQYRKSIPLRRVYIPVAADQDGLDSEVA